MLNSQKLVKIEKSTFDCIIDAIKKEKSDTVAISGTKNINAIKKIAETLGMAISDNNYIYLYDGVKWRFVRSSEINPEINIYNEKGEFNGYGYVRLPKVCEFPKKKIKNFLVKKVKTQATKERKKQTEEEKINAWAKRLDKLTGCGVAFARSLAEEKIEYHQDRIDELIDRDCDSPSKRREKLINKLERENPLRRIVDTDHAERILSASRRHNESNYEFLLEEAKEKAKWGEIDHEDVREYARTNMVFN